MTLKFKIKFSNLFTYVKHVKSEKEKYKIADTDQDGYLDKYEFAAFIMPHHFKYMKPYEFQRLKNKLDSNLDGKISLEEYEKECMN